MRPILAMLATAVLWSTSGLFIKILSMDAPSLAGWRSAIAALTLLAVARARRIEIGVPRDALAWGAAVCYALVLVLFVAATKRTTAANAIFLQYTAPVYVLLLEPLLLGTRFRARDLGFVALALAGMGLFFAGRIGVGDMGGNALALASGLFFGLLSLAMRARRGDDAARWQAVTWGNVLLTAGVVAYFAASPAASTLPKSGLEVFGLLFCGVVQIGIAYALFAYAIARLSALEAMLIGMLEPVLNPVWVFLGTGERPSPWALVGAALIISSVVARTLLEQRDRQRDYPGMVADEPELSE